jgi:hypothetical protein
MASATMTFNQALRAENQPVNAENLAILSEKFGKPASKTSKMPAGQLADVRELFASNGSNGSGPSAPSATDVLAQASQAASPPASPPTPTGITAGGLIEEYFAGGLRGITLDFLVKLAPEAKGDAPRFVRASIIPADPEQRLRATLDILRAIAQQLAKDQAALSSWQPPVVQELVGAVYRYPGVCGHQVETTRMNFERRFAGNNPRETPLLRFCPNCLAVRIALLGFVPGAATAESRCTFCNDPMFASGMHGYIRSRSDIWENLVSGIYRVPALPQRLRPRHPDSYSKHAERSAAIQKFLAWRAVFDREIAIGRSLVPDEAKRLAAGAQKIIKEKAVELGLDLDTDIDTEEGSHA